MNPRLLVLAACLGTGAVLTTLWAGTFREQAATPSRADVGFHDFGTVQAGAELVHEFALGNPLDRTVRVVEARTSCGCMLVGDVEQEIPPGGSGSIGVRLHTERLSGPVEKTVRVAFDGEDLPTRTLRLRGMVENPVTFSPPRLDFGTLVPGERWEREVAVGVSLPDAGPVSVHCDDPYLSIETAARGQRDGRSVQTITVQVDPDVPLGWRATHPLRVQVGRDAAHEYELHVHGRYVTSVRFEPPDAVVLAADPSDAAMLVGTVRMNVPGSSKDPVEISSCEILGFGSGARLVAKGGEVRARETEPGRCWEVQVQVPRDSGISAFLGMLSIRFRHGESQHKTISLRAPSGVGSAQDTDGGRQGPRQPVEDRRPTGAAETSPAVSPTDGALRG